MNNEEILFDAKLLVQKTQPEYGDSLGMRFLIQVDCSAGRIFIDATQMVLMASVGTLPTKDGEYNLDSNQSGENES